MLIALRLLQGLALGGEYGGAAIYVAEHAPQNRRGYLHELHPDDRHARSAAVAVVIMFTQIYVNANFPMRRSSSTACCRRRRRQAGDDHAFNAWGWRIPFLASIVLLLISLYIRLQMKESPAFQKMKEEGAMSKAPLREAFGQWKNAKIALLALLGLIAGQAVVWYTGQFYALFFLQSILKVDSFTANVLIAWSLMLGTGGFVVLRRAVRPDRPQADHPGRLPDRGARPIFPLFKLLTETANPALSEAHQSTPGDRDGRPGRLLVPVQPDRHRQVHQPVRHRQGGAGPRVGEVLGRPKPAGTSATVKIGSQEPIDGQGSRNFARSCSRSLTAAGYPAADNPSVVKIQIEPKDGLVELRQDVRHLHARSA